MKPEKNVLEVKVIALRAYLRFCDVAYEIPREEVYSPIAECNNEEQLRKIIKMLEANETRILEHRENWHDVKEIKESFLQKIFNFFK